GPPPARHGSTAVCLSRHLPSACAVSRSRGRQSVRGAKAQAGQPQLSIKRPWRTIGSRACSGPRASRARQLIWQGPLFQMLCQGLTTTCVVCRFDEEIKRTALAIAKVAAPSTTTSKTSFTSLLQLESVVIVDVPVAVGCDSDGYFLAL